MALTTWLRGLSCRSCLSQLEAWSPKLERAKSLEDLRHSRYDPEKYQRMSYHGCLQSDDRP